MPERIKNPTIPDALRDWELLPASAYVRLPVVQGLYGCSPATIWRRVRNKEIPSPRRFKRITAWNVGDLRRALSNAGK